MDTREKALQRIRALQEEIASLGLVAHGTVVRTFKTCGKDACRCAQKGDPGHGPYDVWSRIEKGRLVRSALSEEEAALFRNAVGEYQRLRRLVRRWETISTRGIRTGTT